MGSIEFSEEFSARVALEGFLLMGSSWSWILVWGRLGKVKDSSELPLESINVSDRLELIRFEVMRWICSNGLSI